MTLSHTVERLPTIATNVFKTLDKVIKKHHQSALKGEPFDVIEKSVHAAFMEAEREVLGDLLSQYDIDSPIVTLEKREYRQSIRCEKTYTTIAGQVSVVRSLYRAKHSEPSICPLELRSGIVEGSWTPVAAKQALLVVSQLPPCDAAHLFSELGAMQPSKSSLDRLPKKLSCQWEQKRDEFEQALQEQFSTPAEAVTLGVSLDGVLIPIQGNVVLPGDSRYQEASCGTITYYDIDGEPLSTRRYGCMPEHKKVRMKNFLAQEVARALKSRPDLQLVKVADGARDNWTFLEGDLPHGVSVLDFYHAAEHLKKVFESVYGAKSIEATVQFRKYRTILRHDEKGVEKIIRHLRSLQKKHPKKETLKTELNYFKNNKHRCDYENLSKEDLPIGSGIVEATCKTLVTQRLKRSGMAWKAEGGQAILTFRALLHSNLFDSAWEKLSREYCADVKLPKNVIPFPIKRK